jgi:alcohol dehydrogenase
VGLSAIMIARALGANVIASDLYEDRLQMASTLGATALLNAASEPDIVEAVKQISGGGAHVSIDAAGSCQTCANSIAGLRKRGKHIQVGLMTGDARNPTVAMHKVIANELEILGSHGMQAHEYPAMLQMISDGLLDPALLVGRTIDLAAACAYFATEPGSDGAGVVVISEFS